MTNRIALPGRHSNLRRRSTTLISPQGRISSFGPETAFCKPPLRTHFPLVMSTFGSTFRLSFSRPLHLTNGAGWPLFPHPRVMVDGTIYRRHVPGITDQGGGEGEAGRASGTELDERTTARPHSDLHRSISVRAKVTSAREHGRLVIAHRWQAGGAPERAVGGGRWIGGGRAVDGGRAMDGGRWTGGGRWTVDGKGAGRCVGGRHEGAHDGGCRDGL